MKVKIEFEANIDDYISLPLIMVKLQNTIAHAMEYKQNDCGNILDYNGNKIGTWEVNNG